MNAKALVVPFAFVTAAAIASWFALRGAGADPAPAPLAGGSAPAASATAGATADLAGSSLTAPAGAAVAGTEAERTVAPPATGGSAPLAAEASIRGRLVDAKGAPRSGIELSLRTWKAAGDGIAGIPLPPPPEGGRARDNRPKFTTRTDGTFRCALAKDRHGELAVETDGLLLAAGTPRIDGGKGDQDLGDVTVLREATVQGIVRDQNGQPVGGVRVGVSLGGFAINGTSASTSAADGTWQLGMLRPGSWTLRTASDRFLPASQELEVAPEQQITGVVLVVKPGAAIAGQVVDDRGIGVPGMKVGGKRRESRGGVDIERFSGEEATATDQHGYFTLSGLAEKTVSVRAFGPGHSSASANDVEVGTGNLVLRVERLASVEGVLQGVDGTPIAGSRVGVGGGPGDGEAGIVLEEDDVGLPGRGATTGTDGTFRLENVRPGNVTLTARGTGHRPVRHGPVAVAPAQATKGVRMVADLGATANVKVADESGKPVANATVKVERAAAPAGPGNMRVSARAHRVEERDGEVFFGGDERLGTGTTDAEGFVRIVGLPAGDLSITATHADFAPALAARVTTPKAGAVDASLTLRKPGQAEILVIGTDGAPAAGVELQVRYVGDDAGRSGEQLLHSNDAGLVRIASLAPGDYEVAMTRPRSATRIGNNEMVFVGGDSATIAASRQPFTVVAGETARVELRRPVLTKLHGVVSGVGGPAADCAVELASEEDGAFTPSGFGGRSARTDGSGTFVFEDVEAGRYLLRFGKSTQLIKAEQEVAVPANTAELRQDLVLRVGSLRVQVVAQGSGDAIEKAEVELVRAARGPAAAGARPQRRVMMVSMTMNADGGGGEAPETTTMTMGAPRAFSDEGGIAVIDDVPVGDYTVRIKHKKYAPHELKAQVVVERQVTECGRVELGAAGHIRGRVLDSDGKQARMALVQRCAIGTEDWSEPEMAMGGTFRLPGLAAGKYRIRAQAIGPTPGGYSPVLEVEVKAGETASAELQLPAK